MSKTKLNKTRFKSPNPKSNTGVNFDNVKTKEQAQQVAIDYQDWASEQSLSYGELFYYQNKLEKLAKRFGLVKEFKENGII